MVGMVGREAAIQEAAKKAIEKEKLGLNGNQTHDCAV